MAVAPVTLCGSLVRLEPLLLSHAPELAQIGLHPDLWRLQPKILDTPAAMQAYVGQALEEQSQATAQGLHLTATTAADGVVLQPR